MKSHITKGSVFHELFDKEEAVDLELRSNLMIAIREFVRKKELTQTEIAEILKVSQARVSDLLTGKIDKFSIGMLLKLSTRLGLQVEVSVKPFPTKSTSKAKAKRA